MYVYITPDERSAHARQIHNTLHTCTQEMIDMHHHTTPRRPTTKRTRRLRRRQGRGQELPPHRVARVQGQLRGHLVEQGA